MKAGDELKPVWWFTEPTPNGEWAVYRLIGDERAATVVATYKTQKEAEEHIRS